MMVVSLLLVLLLLLQLLPLYCTFVCVTKVFALEASVGLHHVMHTRVSPIVFVCKSENDKCIKYFRLSHCYLEAEVRRKIENFSATEIK